MKTYSPQNKNKKRRLNRSRLAIINLCNVFAVVIAIWFMENRVSDSHHNGFAFKQVPLNMIFKKGI